MATGGRRQRRKIRMDIRSWEEENGPVRRPAWLDSLHAGRHAGMHPGKIDAPMDGSLTNDHPYAGLRQPANLGQEGLR
jgi:hypothetical protein